ncbi:type II secretion system inner membrane protein GspF [Nevskia sp.]|uniref:type II secretion system inner membrane protein GspF n=1 Tax=Nevskia sp. TaxID=1929292 RepID=UPI0025E77C0F|nr:type II secretion system inner membrane protein GspF [Nevskia sp.]
MSAYEYNALDAKGRQVKGLIEGDTQRQVRQSLRDRGLTPLEIREVAEKTIKAAASGFSMNRGGSFNSTELSLFTRQLATLIRSGLPLDEGLAAVSQQSESKRVQRVTLGVRSRVTEGNSLAKALGDFPGAFPPLFRATIEAGESAGKLDSVLERLADYAERSQAIKSKVMLATFYPAILTFVAIGVIALLMSYVVPKVVGVFDSIGADLPPLTKGLIATSEFLQAYGLMMFVALVLGFFVFKRALKNDGFRRKYHLWVLRLPLIGRLVRGANTGRFMRTLGILFGSGVPILDAMRIGSQVVENLPMKEAIDAAAKRVREGASLNKSLAESRLFPPITMHLIGSGEASGKLDEMLDRAAENQERELETLIAALMSLFEPILILTMGSVVLLIVLAILLPIFNLNQLVQ